MTAIELLQSGQPFKALPLLMKKVRKEQSIPNILALAACQRACCHFEAAEENLMQLVSMTRGQSAEVLNNVAQLQTDRGKFDEAPVLFQRALAIAQKQPTADGAMQQILLGMAYSLLRLQQFEHTWEAFEAGRLGVSWGALPTTKVWQGEKDARVLIVCEGGFGDAFLFSRWMPQVRAISDKVGVVVWNKLLDFCDWKKLGAHEVLPMLGSIRAADWDYTTSMLSLPGIFKMRSLADIPPDAMLDAYMETVKPGERLMPVREGVKQIGFAWRAEEMGVSRKIRSLDDVTAGALAKELSKMSESGMVLSLCPTTQGLHKNEKFRVSPHVTQDDVAMATWRDTAAYIRTMDLVVTVDTAVWHLAGLLKVPTLLLIPVRSDWKQYTDRTDDPWYGKHVTWYRETNPEGWTVEAIKAAIHAKVEAITAMTQANAAEG